MKHPKPSGFKPDPTFPASHPSKAGLPRCKAWNPNHGRQCQKSPIKGRTTCRSHRGNAVRGLAHPSYQGKGFSKYAPKRLGDLYENLATDKTLATLTADLDLLTARQIDLVTRLESQLPAPELWASLQKTHSQIDQAVRTNDAAALGTGLQRLGQLVKDGTASAGLWDSLFEVTANKRKTIESQTRQLDKLGQFVLITEIMRRLEILEEVILDIHDRYDVPRAASGDIGDALARLFIGPASARIKAPSA